MIAATIAIVIAIITHNNNKNKAKTRETNKRTSVQAKVRQNYEFYQCTAQTYTLIHIPIYRDHKANATGTK